VGFEDITKKAQELLGSQKAQDALKSDKAEGISDKLLDGVANAVDKATGGKFDSQIDGARDAADQRIGTDNDGVTDKRVGADGSDIIDKRLDGR
jgi:MT0933-like antitoxin protein